MTAHAEAEAKDKAVNDEFDALLADHGEGPHLRPVEQAWNDTSVALNDTRNALLLCPAPDYLTVQWKLRALFGAGDCGEDDQFITGWHRRFTDAVIADMDRLQSEFAEAWLAKWTEHGGTVLLYGGKAQFSYPADSGEPMRESGCGSIRVFHSSLPVDASTE